MGRIPAGRASILLLGTALSAVAPVLQAQEPPDPAQLWGSPNVNGDLKTVVNPGIPLGDGALL